MKKLLMVLLLSLPCGATITPVAGHFWYSHPAPSATPQISAGGTGTTIGNYLVLGIAIGDNTTTLNSVDQSDGQNNWVVEGSCANSRRAFIAVAAATTSALDGAGTIKVTAHFSGSASAIMILGEYSGPVGVGTLSGCSTGTGTALLRTTSLQSANDYAVGVGNIQGGQTMSATTGKGTLRSPTTSDAGNGSGSATICFVDNTAASAGNIDVGCTSGGSNPWGMFAINLQSQAPGGGVVRKRVQVIQ